jgi:hypothetical protein
MLKQLQQIQKRKELNYNNIYKLLDYKYKKIPKRIKLFRMKSFQKIEISKMKF